MAAAALAERQERLLSRLLRLEVVQACGSGAPAGADGGVDEAWGAEQPSLGAEHTRLAAELARRGLRCYRFVRVPSDYYEETLQERRRCLCAHSVAHLCKTVRARHAARRLRRC
jgi:hypothetical protein